MMERTEPLAIREIEAAAQAVRLAADRVGLAADRVGQATEEVSVSTLKAAYLTGVRDGVTACAVVMAVLVCMLRRKLF